MATKSLTRDSQDSLCWTYAGTFLRPIAILLIDRR
jgi:hypothetical protein